VTAQLLLGHCAGVNTRGFHHKTPLHLASSGGFFRVTRLRLLIEHGVDIGAQDVEKSGSVFNGHGNQANGHRKLTRFLSNDCIPEHDVSLALFTFACCISYARRTVPNSSEQTRVRKRQFSMSAASNPGAHLVELFPWMIHIPDRHLSVSNYLWEWYARFANWKREAIEHFRQHSGLMIRQCLMGHRPMIS
jgi:hypothetical protein